MNAEALYLLFLALSSITTAAHPSRRTPNTLQALPPISTGPTTYPTTLASTSSFTHSSGIPPNPAFPNYLTEIAYTTATVTIYEPWPASPTSYPLTKVLTEISTVTYRDLAILQDGYPGHTALSTSTVTAPRTWVLHAPPAPTDLPLTAPLPACDGSCNPAGWAPDPRCVELGLETACQGQQCRQRDGVWWCYKRYNLEGADVAMGRVCWGNETLLKELLEPCVVGDGEVGCKSCGGWEGDWNSYTLL